MRQFCLLLCCCCWLAQPASAQENRFSVGGGPSYNLGLTATGLNARGYYFFNEKFCFGPEIIGFLPFEEASSAGQSEFQIYELNFNAHYIFQLSKHWGVYPLVGINYTYERQEYLRVEEGHSNHRVGDVEEVQSLGVNAGGGFHYALGRWIPFLEYEYVRGTALKEHILTSGLFVILGPMHQGHGKAEKE